MQSIRFSMVALIVLACASLVPAQGRQQRSASSCATREAPGLLGFRLGMHPDEVKKSLVEGSLFDSRISAASTVGSSAVNIPAADLKDETIEGVESVSLTFLDNRVSQIKVTYNSASQWDGLQDFFARESAKLNLPKPSGPGALQGSGGNEKYSVRCEGFTAVLAYAFGVSPNIVLSDTAARQKVDKRRDDEAVEVRETKTRSLPLPRRGTDPHPAPPPQPGDPRREPY